MKPKRRNLTRWQENRLRRLDYKLAEYEVSCTKTSPFYDFSPAAIKRCRARAHELACAVQIAWGNENAAKLLNPATPIPPP